MLAAVCSVLARELQSSQHSSDQVGAFCKGDDTTACCTLWFLTAIVLHASTAHHAHAQLCGTQSLCPMLYVPRMTLCDLDAWRSHQIFYLQHAAEVPCNSK